MSDRPLPTKTDPAKKSGGIWERFKAAVKNVSVEINVGDGARRATSESPTDPSARMVPVRQDRKETYDEMIFRTTEGRAGQAPMVRVDRERQQIARKLDSRSAGGAGGVTIPQAAGSPLSKELHARMEPRLGADLSRVRVATGGESQSAAAALGAKAFTIGSDVHFGSGQFSPGSKEGDQLIAHELTHVVQGQRAGVQRKAVAEAGNANANAAEADVSHPDDPAEKEADAVAEHVAGGLHDGEKQDEGKIEPSNARASAAKSGGTLAAPPVSKAAPSIGAKLKSSKIFRSTSPTAKPSGGGSGSALAPPQNPKANELEAELKTVRAVATLDEYHSMIQGLNLLVKPASKASVNLRFTKLKDAIARTKPKLTEIYKDKAPQLIHDWIDSRLAAVHPKPGKAFLPKAVAAKDALLKSPTIEHDLQVDAARPLVNYDVCAPEEAATDQM
ncbi:MAG TPA: DUF4157 domain-containing protein, partial [Polyangia bacterium]|nr:DUF4157 domain-containing protein [Polyangia bacterium]